MLKNAVCLLLQDEKKYYLTPYTDEHEENNQITFSLTNNLTAITIWPHKDEASELEDVKKQLCLKFIELRNMTYAANLRATSTVDFLMDQLSENEQAFVNAIMAEYSKDDNKTWIHEGRSFSTDIMQINLSNVLAPTGFYPVDKELVDKKAFDHACLETLKACVGWPAMKALPTNLNSDEILNNQKLFHPFALQLNNTVHWFKAEADKFAADEVQQFLAAYQTAQQSAAQQGFTTFSNPVSDDKLKNLYEIYKNKLETKLATHVLDDNFQLKRK